MFRWTDRPRLAVDALILVEGKLVVVRRGNEPYKGRYALPGGFVEYGETTEQAVVREVLEETALRTKVLSLFGVYSTPNRDPRGHTVSAVYELTKVGGRMMGGSDAAAAKSFPIPKIPRLAFDHSEIVADFKKKLRRQRG